MIAEVIGGSLAGSLAIITDAAHLLSDVAGFLVSLFAITWSRKRASSKMSYGYHRAEILGALLSISLVWAMTFYLLVEAIDRLRNPVPVDGKTMTIVAILGVLVNAAIGLVLHEHHSHHHNHTHSHETEPLHLGSPHSTSPVDEDDIQILSDSRNINVRAAFLHAIGDLIQSVGVLVAAIVIWVKPEWQITDPLCTFLFSILVVASTWFLARDTVYILMEGTPKDISPRSLQEELMAIDGVLEVHDLHIWSLAPGKISATVHIVIDWSRQAIDPCNYQTILLKCQKVACRKNVHHVTIQVDPDRLLDVHCRVDCCGSQENFLSSTPILT
jgi:cation diffusion facilitator family transporter